MNKTYLSTLAALVVLALSWFGIAHYQHSSPTSSADTPVQKSFTLVVEGRKLVMGPSVLSVTQGDVVTIHITVDEEEELHLHGYDKSIDLEKGKEGSLVFDASASGRFPFELERSKTELGAVEVAPR